MKNFSRIAFSLIFLLQLFTISVYGQKADYKISRTIKLTGDGGWDYLSVDEINSKLYVSHGNQVNIADLKTGLEAGIIPGTKGVHGIAIANKLNKCFISCGQDSAVVVAELSSFKVISKIKVTGKNPDAIIYDSFSNKVFTFNGGSSNSTVIDAGNLKVIGTIALSGKPEFPQSDGKGKIYVNIEDKNSISLINVSSLKVENTWSIEPGDEPSGLAFDLVNQRLFSVCGNKIMIVTDASTGKQISKVDIGDGCDGVSFDPISKRIFASNGEGTMTIIQQLNANEYKVLDNMKTVAGARTITINKSNQKIYIPVADYMQGTGRRPSKPGTFRVFEIEASK